jgi:DNA ligase (NAD+)
MVSTDRIKKLAEDIMRYKRAYYSGEELVPDAVYDKLESELKELDPHHPVLSFVGSDADRGKIPHNPPMLSLQKTYDMGELQKFLAAHECIMMDKCDGVSAKIVYNSAGCLSTGATRSDGRLGEEITSQIMMIPNIPAYIQLPAGAHSMEVRGEIVFPLDTFEIEFKNEFTHPRNAIAGVLGRKDLASARRVLSKAKFIAYFLILKDQNDQVILVYDSFLEEMEYLTSQNFVSPFLMIVEPEEAPVLTKVAFEECPRNHAIDGLVFVINNRRAWWNQGETGHHPKGSLAFKIEGETAITSIESIIVNTGRTGKISFKAKLVPVDLSGAKITYATLHNAQFIEEGGYGPGCEVQIIRSGEVIPYIQKCVAPGAHPYILPQMCGCGSTLERRGPDLFCSNNECDSRQEEYLNYFLKTIEVKGLSEKGVEKFIEAGLVSSPSDFFKIKKEQLMVIEGFQDKSAQNIIDAIQSKRELELGRFLASLGIRGLGKSKAYELSSLYPSLDIIRSITLSQLLSLKGWADTSAQQVLDGLKTKAGAIDALLEFVTIKNPKIAEAAKGDLALSGVSVVITGKLSMPRAQFEKKILEAGGKLSDSVSSATSFLVCDAPSESSKYKKAIALGISIITEAELLEKIG